MSGAEGRSGEEGRGDGAAEGRADAVAEDWILEPRDGKGSGRGGRGTDTVGGSLAFGGGLAANVSGCWVSWPPKVRFETDCALWMAICRW